eukprot:CAMPEP_0194710276 /NCGR_PEP_ID=MMETSP0296-20130528/2883_1 /TAXON_ID=39354 /ORGANISM="Heterosigma akashiwo, Strain CCMP2393" /LENGTH=315 /DNA_ID=CAMNT_0039607895 /DNA_START=104 /DNA_END=1051 /DNA_ORIENTATION=+
MKQRRQLSFNRKRTGCLPSFCFVGTRSSLSFSCLSPKWRQRPPPPWPPAPLPLPPGAWEAADDRADQYSWAFAAADCCAAAAPAAGAGATDPPLEFALLLKLVQLLLELGQVVGAELGNRVRGRLLLGGPGLGGQLEAAGPYTEDAAAAAQQQQQQGGGLATRGLEDDIYKGVWSVCFAPHIYTLSKIFLTEFKPIEYHLLPGNSIESYVRYSNPLIGAGWLNAAGSIDVRDDMSVKITFDNFWWDIQTSEPRSLETFLQDFRTSPPSATDVLVQNIGKAGFLESFSIFPLQYLDETLCIFEFPPLGVKIVASKV